MCYGDNVPGVLCALHIVGLFYRRSFVGSERGLVLRCTTLRSFFFVTIVAIYEVKVELAKLPSLW